MKTQTGSNIKSLIYETMGKKYKRLYSFKLVVLLRESGSEFQYLATAYLTELRPYVFFGGGGVGYLLSYSQKFWTEITL